MYVEQLYTGCLAEAAYYIESEGEAAIIDPLRETEPYLEKARQRGATIRYIFETHFHADFVSGHVDLAKKTGATIIYGPTAKTAYAIHEAKDGETFQLGNVTFEVMHTPGHTPESSTYLLRNEAGEEHAIFTGDTLFIGDVGRPDLAIKGDLTQEDLAGLLFDSLRSKIMPLPDSVLVYPAHGAGSACGKNMSDETFSTLGEQKRSNYALQDITREDFIKELTTGILPPPQYFPKNAMINKTGYGAVDAVLAKGERAVSVEELVEMQKNGVLVLDTRDPDDFCNGHVPGSMFIGLDGSFAVWVGTLITDIERQIVVITEPGHEQEAVLRLARVGYDHTIGYLKGGFAAWQEAGLPVDNVAGTTAKAFESSFAEDANVTVYDVRKPGEYEAEHLESAVSRPLDFIREWQDNQHEGPVYVHCKSGYRSVVACSLLKANGHHDLVNIEGGFEALAETSVPRTTFQCASEVG